MKIGKPYEIGFLRFTDISGGEHQDSQLNPIIIFLIYPICH